MNQDYYSKNLEEGEEVVAVVRPHPIIMARVIFFGGLIILADFFFLTWLFSRGGWGIAVFFLFLLCPSFFIIRAYFLWSKNIFLISSKRVIDIDQHGLFHKVVSECGYEKIQDVSFTIRGLWATLFKFGKIEIQTAGSQANLEINFIRSPHRVQELITNEMRKALSAEKTPPVSDQELAEAITKVKKRLDDETLKKLFKE